MDDQPQNTELSKKTRLILLILVMLLIASVIMVKLVKPAIFSSGESSPQVTLEQSLQKGKPVMVFFYSDDCRNCIEMKKTIDEVYPDYEAAVTLVEVNVYDPGSRELVERTGVHTTPVELFIHASGSETLVLDVMSAEDLQSQFQSLSGGQP